MKTILVTLVLILLSNSASASERFYQNILYVGDSHSYGSFGSEMFKFLEKKSNRLMAYASCGASSSTWLGKKGNERTVCGFWSKESANGKVVDEVRSNKFKTPKFETLLQNNRPDLTIIQLGTNMAVGNPKSAIKSIEEMLKVIQANNSKCLWIGPPDANSKVVPDTKLKELNRIIKGLSAKYNCSYIDSLKLTAYPLHVKEGIHYPNKDSINWANKVKKLIY